jgi:hypothetical protein
MPIIKRARSAQWLLVSEFVFNYNDLMAPLGGAPNFPNGLVAPQVDLNLKSPLTDFGYGPTAIATGLINGVYTPPAYAPLLSGVLYNPNPNTGSTFFEVIALGINTQIVGGEIQIEQPFVFAAPGTGTVFLSLGDINSGALFLPPTSLKVAALGGTGYVSGAHVGNVVTLTVGTGHNLVIGNIIAVVGATGANATAYNGVFTVTAVTPTTIQYINAAAYADTGNAVSAGPVVATYTVGRIPLTIPGEETNQGGYSYVINQGTDAAAGYDVRATLTFTGGLAATQGRVRIRFWYTIDGRANEVKTT